MNRIVTIAFAAAAISTLALSAAQAGWGTGSGGINGTSINGLDSSNGFGNNGLDSANGIILNGWNNGSLNGISVSEKAGQTILEIRLTDGTVARR